MARTGAGFESRRAAAAAKPVARWRAIWQAMIMRQIASVLALAAALAGPASAQMSAEEFDAYTRGQTFFYGAEGQEPYGAEEYLPGQRVRWSFLDGECQEGYWYAEGPLICFVYENRPDPQCWSFERSTGRLVARFEGDSPMTELYEVRKSREPLQCPGPKVGV
jgi:hypothetical protein